MGQSLSPPVTDFNLQCARVRQPFRSGYHTIVYYRSVSLLVFIQLALSAYNETSPCG